MTSYHDSMFAKILIFSKVSQKVILQGAILSQQGMKPLYRERTPSVLTAVMRQ